MKKILMGTTAIIALASFSSQAIAADKIKLELGGFQKAFAGKISRASVDGMLDFAATTNTEVYFTGSTTLDNGLTVSTHMQLEMDGGANYHNHGVNATAGATPATSGAITSTKSGIGGTDQSYLTVSSDSMGALIIGATTGAAPRMSIGAPSVGPVGFGGDVTDWDNGFGWNAIGTGYDDDDSVKGVYLSPDFNGVQIGTSYTIGQGFGGNHNGRNVLHAQSGDAFDVAVAYSGEMSGANVGVSGTYQMLNSGPMVGGGEHTSLGLGVEIGMNGVTVGGSYVSQDDGRDTTNTNDGSAYDLGVAYETGAVSVAATYSHGSITGAAKDKMWAIGAGYDLGAGVSLVAEYYNAKSTTIAPAVTQTTSGVVAGIEIGF